MPRPDFPRTIVEFQQWFPDDGACAEYLFASRWPEGFRCPRYGQGNAWAVSKRRVLLECAACHLQTSLTAGTVLHKTRTALHLWFWAAYLMSTPTPGTSALQLQRQLGLGRYETAWMMLHKLRRAMINLEREPLTAEVEVDECFVGGHEAGLPGGRARGTKALVVVGVEVRGAGSGRVRMAVVDDASARTLTGFVRDNVASGATVHTDAWKGYRPLSRFGYDHRPRSQRAARGRRRHGRNPAASTPRDLQPKKLAPGNPPRRLRRASAGLPRRVRVPIQPPTHPDGRLPDPARPAIPTTADHLPADRRKA